jgi:hypothetical protein
MALAIALSIPTIVIAVYGIFGLMAPTTGNDGVMPLVLASVLGFVAYWLGNSRNSASIGINHKALKTGSGSYDLDHITALNQSGPRIGGVIASGV